MEALRTRDLAILLPALAAGLAGTLVAAGGRGAESEFVQNQRNVPRLQPAEVERVVQSAPDPRIGTGSGSGATCRPLGSGPLRNPWRCVVRYPSGRQARLSVRILKEDGSYLGRYAGGGAAEGCCVVIPGTE